ncbi:hypothetical protein DYB37_006484 [Aphanomyces astaci]|uniref:PX domain-containing protein n=1 Tax=Aphanomyces astaci TaxID=112090 RepID=A0A396ZY64_APHAT|nr:hypothetical protein DYB36_010663 [Aphanomyces astaci]RHZ16126.1 hypothetical protein DYB37_006484 [Aphanomyces astaci]RLO10606.1 hypothetical protein DYB28_009034 [Aphanomyces astaci]
MPHHPVKDIASITDATCCVRGTCLSKSHHGLFPSVEIGFDIRVEHPSDSWVVRCTLRDVDTLHHNLRQNISDRSFHEDISRLLCPKLPLFHRRDMLVIKGLCVDLDHYVDELVKLCHRFTTKKRTADTDTVLVEGYLRAFLTANATTPI